MRYFTIFQTSPWDKETLKTLGHSKSHNSPHHPRTTIPPQHQILSIPQILIKVMTLPQILIKILTLPEILIKILTSPPILIKILTLSQIFIKILTLPQIRSGYIKRWKLFVCNKSSKKKHLYKEKDLRKEYTLYADVESHRATTSVLADYRAVADEVNWYN